MVDDTEGSTGGESTVSPQIAGCEGEMSEARKDICSSFADHLLEER
jgi:hypothetical protein